MIFILESEQFGTLDSGKGFDKHGKEIMAYTDSHRLAFLKYKRSYEIIKEGPNSTLKKDIFCPNRGRDLGVQ